MTFTATVSPQCQLTNGKRPQEQSSSRSTVTAVGISRPARRRRCRHPDHILPGRGEPYHRRQLHQCRWQLPKISIAPSSPAARPSSIGRYRRSPSPRMRRPRSTASRSRSPCRSPRSRPACPRRPARSSSSTARPSWGRRRLSGGSATYSTAGLAVGPQAITALYGGDSNFNTSTSAAISKVV